MQFTPSSRIFGGDPWNCRETLPSRRAVHPQARHPNTGWDQETASLRWPDHPRTARMASDAIHARTVPLRRQQGQVLPLGMLLFALTCGLVLFYGQHALQIARNHHQQNLADAAAYGAAVWRARALNFNAFANRALLAQEVFAGHLTQANAWAQYALELAKRGQELAQIFPPAQPVASALTQFAQTDATLLRHLSDLELFARTAPGVGLNDSLMAAQRQFLRSADGFGLSAVANELARDADSKAFAYIPAGDRFGQIWTQAEDARQRAQTLDFVRHAMPVESLGSKLKDQWTPLPTVNCIPQSVEQLTARLLRESSLWRDARQWRSSETMSLHGWQRRSWLPWCGARTEWLPLGWGGSIATDASVDDREAQDGDPRWPANPTADHLATSSAITLQGYQGSPRITRVLPDAQLLRSEDSTVLRDPLRILVIVRRTFSTGLQSRIGAARVVHADSARGEGDSEGNDQTIEAQVIEGAGWLFPLWRAEPSVPTEQEKASLLR